MCHCEERSDVAISQYRVGSQEDYRRNRDCLPEIAPQGHFLALRAQRRHVGLRPPRNDKSEAFAILTVACTDCKCVAGPGCPLPALHKRFAQAAVKMVTAPTGPVAALSERPVGSNSTVGGRWCTSRSPDVSLRGAKRRGNLAVPSRITGHSRRNRDCLPEIAPQGHFLALRAQGATSAVGLLAMTNRRPVPF